MAKTPAPSVAELYHGTSGTAAVEIIRGGAICPAASSPELAKRYFLPKAPHHADQRCVYLIPTPHEAIMFGMARSVGMKWRRGKYEINAFSTGKSYDSVVVFLVNVSSLNPLLFRDSSLYENEVAYEGVVDLGERMEGVEFPMTRDLYELARDVQTPKLLRQYVGMDLVEYLQGQQFSLQRGVEV